MAAINVCAVIECTSHVSSCATGWGEAGSSSKASYIPYVVPRSTHRLVWKGGCSSLSPGMLARTSTYPCTRAATCRRPLCSILMRLWAHSCWVTVGGRSGEVSVGDGLSRAGALAMNRPRGVRHISQKDQVLVEESRYESRAR